MIWTVTGITFLATLTVLMAILYGFAPQGLTIAERLVRLWQPESAARPESGFKEKQKERVGRILGDVGRLLPSSPKQSSSTRRLLVRAGYRRQETAAVMGGVKILLPAGLLGLVYFTRLYEQSPVLVLGIAGLLGFMLPDLWLSRKVRKRQHRLRLALPDALDLMVVCIEAGLALDQAVMRVAKELRFVHPELSDEFELMNSEIRLGRPRVDALRDLANRTGVDDIKALVAMLIQTERFGTSIGKSLRVHSDDLRTKRRQRAEEAAAKTTVKMVPPLVFCIFPALFAVILGPAIIAIGREFLHK